MVGDSPLVDARLEPTPGSRRDVRRALPPHLRLRAWWIRQMDARMEDAVRGVSDAGRALRLVTPTLVLLLVVPAIVVLHSPGNGLAMLSLACGAAAVSWGLLAERLERRHGGSFAIEVASACFHAGLISLLLAAFVSVEHQRLQLHAVIFLLYFLLIGAVGLRDDPRQAVVAGTASVIGYCAVVLFAHQAAGAGNPVATKLVEDFDWVANSIRLTLLVGVSLIAIASAERGRALRRLSLRDGLTGLLNRRAFDECLARMATAAPGHGSGLTIAMIDIDEFKQLNDRYGHTIGDTVLRWVASRIERHFRTGDLVARYGGEEFVVALPTAGDTRIDERLEVLRAHIATSVLHERRIDAGNDESEPKLEVRTTVSIGVARMPEDGPTPEDVLRCADRRLYRAKAQGRNRVVRKDG